MKVPEYSSKDDKSEPNIILIVIDTFRNLKKKMVSYELYDIKNDSEEKQKLSINNVEAQVLLNALNEFEKLDRPISSAPKKIRKELEKKLRALGYIH